MDSTIIDIKVTESPILVMDSVDDKWKTVPVSIERKRERGVNAYVITLGVQYYCDYRSIYTLHSKVHS